MSHHRKKQRVQGAWAAAPLVNDKQGTNGPKQSAPGFNFAYETPSPVLTKAVCPRNFDWVEAGLLCALACPSRPEHIEYLVQSNVKYVVSCMENVPKCIQDNPAITSVHLRVRSFGVPSQEQVAIFLKLIETAQTEQKAVAVHCLYGNGRTGTLIACYLMKQHNLSAVEAVRRLRRQRPDSVENQLQEDFVCSYEKSSSQNHDA